MNSRLPISTEISPCLAFRPFVLPIMMHAVHGLMVGEQACLRTIHNSVSSVNPAGMEISHTYGGHGVLSTSQPLDSVISTHVKIKRTKEQGNKKDQKSTTISTRSTCRPPDCLIRQVEVVLSPRDPREARTRANAIPGDKGNQCTAFQTGCI